MTISAREKIKDYIHKNGLKQSYIAKKIGVNPKTFSAMLNGRNELRADVVVKVGNALGIPASIFLPSESKEIGGEQK